MRGEVLAGVFVAAFIVLVWSVRADQSGVTVLALAVIAGTLVTHLARAQGSGRRLGRDRPWRDRRR